MDDHKKSMAGTEFDLPADLVLLGIGQAKLGELLGGLPGVTLDKGRVVVDASGFTGRRGLWAGGDCTNGGKEVVNAVAEGKSAAIAIDEYLTTTAAAARQAKEAPHG
jgi:glutamate synthase (NADPH/NADH) small chain